MYHRVRKHIRGLGWRIVGYTDTEASESSDDDDDNDDDNGKTIK